MREREQGVPLIFSAVWDTVRTGYLMSSGTRSENVDEALQPELLNGSAKPARVLMAQVRQPFTSRNGQEPRARRNIDDMSVDQLRQECYENRNTIQQMQKTAEPNKRQRQSNWQGRRGWTDQQPASNSHTATKPGVHVPEGAGKDNKMQPKSPGKAQARMLRTSRKGSDSDEDVVYERANLVRLRDGEDKMGTGTSVVHEEDSPFSMGPNINLRFRAGPQASKFDPSETRTADGIGCHGPGSV